MIRKFMGRDNELSTTGIDEHGKTIDSLSVTRQILAQIKPALEARGLTVWSDAAGRHQDGMFISLYSTDFQRNWTQSGQCYYGDLGHVEACTPTGLFPRNLAAQCIGTLLACEDARRLAESEAPSGTRLFLSATCMDLIDPALSFGPHFNVSVEPRLWEDLILDHRRPAVLGWVASALIAATAFFGAGYLLPMKDGRTIFSLSGRAVHNGRLVANSTTEPFARGPIEGRRERHCKNSDRLHLIGSDFAVLSEAFFASFVQCTLAAAEEGFCGLNLLDPLRALREWCWKLDLRSGQLPAKAQLTDGRKLSLPDYMREVTSKLLEMCECGLITDDVAPEARDLLPRIIELTEYLEEGSIDRCARHLTWAAKLLYLLNLCENEGAQLGDAVTRLADHDFLGTNPTAPFWRLWEEDVIDPLVTIEEARQSLFNAPSESRCWGRGQIIKRFPSSQISSVDWSYVELFRDVADRWSPRLRIDMPCLDSLNRPSFQHIIDNVETVEQLEHALTEQATHEPHVVIQQSDPIADIQSQLALGGETTTRPNDDSQT